MHSAFSRFSPIVVFLFITSAGFANDGVFKANGNHLIPMYETDISVRKEILTIRRSGTGSAQITVYYEFFNPKEDKTVEVGFEAFSPSGDIHVDPDPDGQPFISNFTVQLNGAAVPYHVTIVEDSLYYRNGKYKALPMAKAIQETKDEEAVDFFYVYHFRALFKKGINIIKHTYAVDLSSSVEDIYSLSYVLTGAKRWANRQIDDFTLQIDMGDFQDLALPATFFDRASEWAVDGVGKGVEIKGEDDTSHMAQFFVRKGMLTYKKLNFRPAGELYLTSYNSYYYYQKSRKLHPELEGGGFDYKTCFLPFSIEAEDGISDANDELSKKIKRNLPFARRGYVFKSPELRSYYERQPWYMPDPAYTPVEAELTKKEQEWLNHKF
jgi:hypothetical protein